MADEGDEPETVHHWHCNANMALCGEDLTGGEDMDAAEATAAGTLCVVCADLAPQPCEITCPLVVFT